MRCTFAIHRSGQQSTVEWGVGNDADTELTAGSKKVRSCWLFDV